MILNDFLFTWNIPHLGFYSGNQLLHILILESTLSNVFVERMENVFVPFLISPKILSFEILVQMIITEGSKFIFKILEILIVFYFNKKPIFTVLHFFNV